MGDENERLRCLSQSFSKNRAINDGFETATSRDQAIVENDVEQFIQVVKDTIELEPDAPELFRSSHVKYLMKGLHSLPSCYENLDASRPWLCYWILHSLELLDEPVSLKTKSLIIKFLSQCQHPEGGFGGGPGQDAHLAPTYASVCALSILQCPEALNVIDRTKLLKFLLRVKNPDGSFKLHEDSESDLRGVYCALSIAMITSIWCKPLIDKTAHWVSRCQTYEGGFGGIPGMEAHGGYTFCGLASLMLLKEGHLININNLLRWLVNKQMSYEGGFQGRTNKLVDSCYSFWQSSCFPLIHKLLSKITPENLSESSSLFHQKALQEYILIFCQHPDGGLLDKIGKKRDFYHTCYSLSGLSIAQHLLNGDWGSEFVVGKLENELVQAHPIYNICLQSASQAVQYFQSLSIPGLPENLDD